MTNIVWFSLAIIVISLIIFIYSLTKAKAAVKSAKSDFADLKQSAELEVRHYTNELDYQMEKVEQLKDKVELLQGTLQSETMTIEHFQLQQADLKNAILTLEKNIPEIVEVQSETLMDKIKEKSTKSWEALKLTFKKNKTRISK